MKNFIFPAEKNELKNYIVNNFNAEEFAAINMDPAFENCFINFKMNTGLERSIHYCSIVANQDDGYNRKWVIDFYERHKDNASVLLMVWAHFCGFTSDELYQIASSI